MKRINKKMRVLVFTIAAVWLFTLVYPLIRGKDYYVQGSIEYRYNEDLGVVLTFGKWNSTQGDTLIMRGYPSCARLTPFERCFCSDIFALTSKCIKGKNEKEEYPYLEVSADKRLYATAISGNFLINLPVFLVCCVYYRHIWGGFVYAVFSIVFVIFAYCASEYTKDRSLTFSQKKQLARDKCGLLLKFALCCFAVVLVLNVLTGLVFKHFLPADVMEKYYRVVRNFKPFWANAVTAALYIAVQAVLLSKFFKGEKRLIAAYIPTAALISGAVCPLYYTGLCERLQSITSLYPFIPFFAKFGFYIIMLLPAVLLFSLFLRIYTKNTVKRLAYSIVFAFCACGICFIDGFSAFYLIRLT
ncbi:MAG: hypothetical protein IKS17_09400 [Firmicutes bacterium]|nr:hypothetical protein [Bacillota bacterium]